MALLMQMTWSMYPTHNSHGFGEDGHLNSEHEEVVPVPKVGREAGKTVPPSTVGQTNLTTKRSAKAVPVPTKVEGHLQ